VGAWRSRKTGKDEGEGSRRREGTEKGKEGREEGKEME